MIVCSVATVPGREQHLARALHSLRTQVDHLVLHVWDDYDIAGALHLVDQVVPAKVSGRTSTEAKFWIAHEDRWTYGDAVHLPCDDDIVYPPNYVARLVEELDHHHLRSGAVGVYGAVLAASAVTSYRHSIRLVAGTEAALEGCRRVDVLGAGTVAYRPELWALDDHDLQGDNAGDAGFALAAARRGLSLVAVQRPACWLVDQRAPDPLWDCADRDDPGAPAAVALRKIPRRRV